MAIRPSTAAVALLALASASPLAAARAQRHTLTGDNAAVYNLAGSIRVEGGSGSSVVVEVTKRGRDGEKLEVQSGRVRGQEALRVIYPSDRIVFPDADVSRWDRTEIRVNEDGTFDGDWDGRRGRDRVRITSSGSGLEAWADVRVMLPKGQRITVHLAAGEASVENADGDITVDVYGASVTTRHTRGVLDLDTGSGEVRISDAEGEVRLDSGSGRVTLEGVRGESLDVDSGSGEVSGGDISVRRLNIDSGSGEVDLKNVASPDLAIDSGSGSIGLQLVADVKSMRVDAGSGSVTIGIPESLGAELVAETGSGGIDFGIEVTVLKKEDDYVRAKIGDGDGRISIDSGSGHIRLRRS
jgi:DUF4097 and DUF4098 domain-containing protein YvlB